MSVLKMFLNKMDRMIFHMIDGTTVDVHTDSVKDINEDDGFYGIYMDTGKLFVIWDKNVSWMEIELKHEPEKASDI